MKRVMFATLALALLLAAASADNYRTAGNGTWSSAGTWERFNGASWVPATRPPGPADNVQVLATDTVYPSGGPDSCHNLRVESGGVIYWQGTFNRYVMLYGDTVNNLGTIGGSGSKVCFECMAAMVFTGPATGNVYNVGWVRVGAPDVQITFDDEFEVHYNGLGLYANNYANAVFVVNSGDTLLMTNGADFSFGASASDTARVAGQFIINGMVFTDQGSKFNISVGNGKLSSLNLMGTISLGDSLIADGPGTGEEWISLWSPGGQLDYNGDYGLQVMDYLQINQSQSFYIDQHVRIQSRLNLTNGWLQAASVQFADMATIQRTQNCSLRTTPSFDGKVNLFYTEYGGEGPAITTGREVPAADTAISWLYIDANLVLDRDLTCNDSLWLADTVTGTDYRLWLHGTATLFGGYVNGPMERDFSAGGIVSRDYFIGSNNGYSPMSATCYNVASEMSLYAKANEGPQMTLAMPERGLKRNWMFSISGGTYNAIRLLVTYLPVDFNTGFVEATDEDSMRVIMYNTSNGSWFSATVSGRYPGGPNDGGSIEIYTPANINNYILIPVKDTTAMTGVAGGPATPTVATFALLPVRPNPARGAVTIQYQLPKASRVTLELYSITGQLVKRFDEGVKQPGYHSIRWDAAGHGAGVYFYRLKAGDYSATRKLVIVK